MRVIAGSAGGLRLQVPPTDVRPTMDRVKAAIFSSLAERVPGAHVLDLFAGTGGLGIEALSRGAAAATFIESDRRAADAIRVNLASTGLSGRIHQIDAIRFLNSAAPEQWDIIFADAPYGRDAKGREVDYGSELIAAAALPPLLAAGGIFVLEKLPSAALLFEPLWECVRLRRYGATEVAFLRRPQSALLNEERSL